MGASGYFIGASRRSYGHFGAVDRSSETDKEISASFWEGFITVPEAFQGYLSSVNCEQVRSASRVS